MDSDRLQDPRTRVIELFHQVAAVGARVPRVSA